MKVSDLKQSQFLKKEDVGNGILVTIRQCVQENVALPGATPDMKWALHFDEVEKPLILNQTNGALIQAITGSDDSDHWLGKKIVLFTDATIMYAGKIVGGIRVRAPRGKAAQPQAAPAPAKPAPAPAPAEDQQAADEDNCPF